jgi:ATP-dependent Clp protease ATP-binding subunit ClpC
MVVVYAQDEARELRHEFIGTEHLLLGLLNVEESLGARVLESLNVGIDEVRARVVRIVGMGDEVPAEQLPFTPRSQKVLELALREALSLGHNYIGTEHILLGIVRENEGVAARVLLDLDGDAETVRNEMIRQLSGPGRRQPPSADSIGVKRRRQAGRKRAGIDPRGVRRRAGFTARPIAIGLVVAAVGFPLGLFVGWLTWG